MSKILSTQSPRAANAIKRVNPVRTAMLNALLLWLEESLLVMPRKIGMFPRGSTTIRRDTTDFRKFIIRVSNIAEI